MDNKYANLPGIAKNEPDVYETVEVTNEALASANKSIVNDEPNVQKIDVNMKECYNKFNAKQLSSDFVDFSDVITNRRKFGYVVEPETFEWNQDITEGPYQKYKRLEREINELKVELTEVAKLETGDDGEAGKPSAAQPFDAAELSKLVDSLQKHVSMVHLQAIGADATAALDIKGNKQSLMVRLDELKLGLSNSRSSTKTTQAKGAVASAITTDESLVYKLFYDIDQMDVQREAKIQELNQRMANIEQIFGAGNAAMSETKLAKICSNVENKSILGLVENLNSKLSVLETHSIDQIESRLHLLLQRVAQLNEKKSAFSTLVEDQEKMSKINELYAMTTNWKDVSAKIPAIVERLAALDKVHQKALQFSSILSRLDEEQRRISRKIETSSDTLNLAKNKLESSLEAIKSSFDLINERITTINASNS